MKQATQIRVGLLEARERFAELLGNDADEGQFQRLFRECPYILSRALPLGAPAVELVPLARPGRSEADLIFYPRDETVLPSYGIIELKRPSSKIVTLPRKGIITLSRDAASALEQARTYLSDVEAQHAESIFRSLIIGNHSRIFVIMGLSSELVVKVTSDLLRTRLLSQIPPNANIIPYDQLLSFFEHSIPPRIMVLVPEVRSVEWHPDMYDLPIVASGYDPSVRLGRALGRLLRSKGFTNVLTTESSTELLALCSSVLPRLVIRDFNYMDVGGFELTQRIKAIPGMGLVRQMLMPPRGFGWEESDDALEEGVIETDGMVELTKRLLLELSVGNNG